MEKLVLIDGNSLLNRAFYATTLFSTSTGMPTNAIFGFVKFILKIFKDEKPEYIIVAFDMKAPTFRHLKYEGYKANRSPMPDELAVQVEPLKQLLKAMNISICQQEGIEADDILGTLSKKFDVHSLIYTGDRDSYQLVDNKTDVFYTKKGVSDLLRLNVNNFTELTGLTPKQVIDFKALMGDKSDNIPGVMGIGEKTALKLLNEYGSVTSIYENVGKLSKTLQDKLLNGRQLADLSYDLATIDRNCNIDIDLKDCKAPQKFGAEVRKMFNEFEFKSLLSMDIFEEDSAVIVENREYPQIIECKRESDFADALKEKKFATVIGDGVAEINAGGKQYSIKMSADLFESDGLSVDAFCNILHAIYCNPENTVLAYDYKKQLHSLNQLEISPECDFGDLSLLTYLCDSNLSNFTLKELVEHFSYEPQYTAFAISELFGKYFEQLKKDGLEMLYNDIEKPLVGVLYDMERTGVKISVPVLDEISAQYAKRVEEYKDKIYKACGGAFNINSPAQLGEKLYNVVGIAEVKKKKTGKYSTGAEVLEKLTEKYPVAGDVLKYRQYQKLNSTYVEGFLPLLDKNSVVHTTFNQTVTATGRLSSSNPNLQNIPVREVEGKELRKVFIPREGSVFIDADYSQIELRLLAHFSGCKELIEAYNTGRDIHALTASQVFGVPEEEVTPKMRREAKAVNFGIIYGISDFGLSQNLNIPVSVAKAYIEKYFATYSEVKNYMNANVEFARANGYVSTLTGRRRVIREINSSNFNLRQFGDRAAMNMPLQGSSADIIKIAMINVVKALKDKGLKTKLILQVHDELVLEAPKDEQEAAAEILKYEMEHAAILKVPLTVEVHTGENWYDAK